RESGFDTGHRGRADGNRRARAVALGNRQDAQPHAGDAAQVGGGPGAETEHRPLGPMTADAPPDAAASASFCPPLARVRRQIRYATFGEKRPEGRGCHGWIFGPGAVAERNIQGGVAPKEETMSKPFDATLKTLLEESPVDWPALAGHPEQTVEVIDADISIFTGATDKVLRVRGLPDWIMHFEFQSGPDATLPRRLHGYNALLEQCHDLLVRSVVVLLRRQADLANVTGVYERQFANEP